MSEKPEQERDILLVADIGTVRSWCAVGDASQTAERKLGAAGGRSVRRDELEKRLAICVNSG